MSETLLKERSLKRKRRKTEAQCMLCKEECPKSYLKLVGTTKRRVKAVKVLTHLVILHRRQIGQVVKKDIFYIIKMR